MEISKELIKEVIGQAVRRCEAARMIGGIALRDAVDGMEVPEGWKLDPVSMYYVPPDAHLEEVKVVN